MFQNGSKDPAASMSLLRLIEEHSLDPAYRATAQAQRNRGPGAQKRRSPWFALVILASTLLLGWGSTVAATNLRLSSQDSEARDSGLSKEVEDARQTVADLEESTSDLRAQVRASEVLEGGSVAVPNGVGVLASTTRVQGPGVVVTLEDGSATTGSGLLTDQHLRTVKNLLWSAGAEAIAIDGNRIGPDTSIRTAGSTILVNLTPISSPYVLEAIGDPAALLTALEESAAAEQIDQIERFTGSPVSVVRSEKLTLGALPLPTTWSVEISQSGKGTE